MKKSEKNKNNLPLEISTKSSIYAELNDQLNFDSLGFGINQEPLMIEALKELLGMEEDILRIE